MSSNRAISLGFAAALKRRVQSSVLSVSMALSAKLVMRQGQALVMTPQLMQAIKLLQLSNLELAAFL